LKRSISVVSLPFSQTPADSFVADAMDRESYRQTNRLEIPFGGLSDLFFFDGENKNRRAPNVTLRQIDERVHVTRLVKIYPPLGL